MNSSRSLNLNFAGLVEKIMNNRAALFGFMIFGALIAFEIFNFTTTQFALHDVLGDLTFAGVRWATILAIAFCSIDFAGIARIFTPEQGKEEPAEVWYLFGAWLLAAAMNATLTWWGVAVAIEEKGVTGTSVVSSATLTTAVPIFVALMVWVIRVLIISTFSSMGDRLFSGNDTRRRGTVQIPRPAARPQQTAAMRPVTNQTPRTALNSNTNTYQASGNNRQGKYQPQYRPVYNNQQPRQQQEAVLGGTRTSNEPTYHNVRNANSVNEDRYSAA